LKKGQNWLSRKAFSLLDTDEVGFPVQEVSGLLIQTKSKLPQFTLFPTSLTNISPLFCFPPLPILYEEKERKVFQIYRIIAVLPPEEYLMDELLPFFHLNLFLKV